MFNDSATQEVVRRSLESCREWDYICQDPKQLFATATNLGVCSLYHNLTAAVSKTDKHTVAIQRTETVIPTCLVSYCAQETLCSSDTTTNCSIGSLISTNGHLSRHGVGRCWHEICYNFNVNVNPDIGGLGVRRSPTTPCPNLLTVLVDYLLSHANNNRTLGLCDFRASPFVQKVSRKDKDGLAHCTRILLWNEARSCAQEHASAERRQRTFPLLALLSVQFSQSPVHLLDYLADCIFCYNLWK